MRDLHINLPASFEDAVHLTEAELADHIRLMAALKMFELGKISAGKAAELSGLSKAHFIRACQRYKVSVYNYPDEEVAEELANDVANIKQVTNK